MEQQNKNELTARQGRSSLSRNDRIPGGKGSQGPITSSKPFQRPVLQASRPDALPDTTKQVELGTQPMNDISVFSHLLFGSRRYLDFFNFFAQ